MELPRILQQAVADDASPRRRAWLADLPRTVDDLAARWSLRIGPPFQPGGECAWVAPARDARGRDLVLKVGWRHPEAEHEGAGLRAWRGRGAVEVHDAWTGGDTDALLLERCHPGTPLGELRRGPEQDGIVAAMLRELWHEPAPGHPFRPLVQLCDLWADEVEGEHAGVLDPGIARVGVELFRSLPREPAPEFLLVTDLHAANILAHGDGWRLIDPKPYVGDPCYDTLQHLHNERDRLTADPDAMVRRMAALTGLDAGRVRLWALAKIVVESAWTPWLAPVATALAP